MQNGVEDIYSQLKFLRISGCSDWNSFHDTFIRGFKVSNERGDAMLRFQALLKAVLLRRTKTSKIDGAEILALPAKTIQLVHAVLDPEHLEFYRALETGAIAQITEYVTSGALGRNYLNALTLLLRLRQACLHPHLTGATGSVEDNQVALARNLGPQTVQSIGAFKCPICFEAVENPSRLFPGCRVCAPLSTLDDSVIWARQARCPPEHSRRHIVRMVVMEA